MTSNEKTKTLKTIEAVRERERERELYFTKIKYSLLRYWHKFNKEINKKIVAKPMENIGL